MEFLDKFRNEVATAVGDDLLRGPMILEDFSDENLAEIFGVWNPWARDESGHLGESVCDHKYCVVSLCSDW